MKKIEEEKNVSGSGREKKNLKLGFFRTFANYFLWIIAQLGLFWEETGRYCEIYTQYTWEAKWGNEEEEEEEKTITKDMSMTQEKEKV